MGNNIVFYMCLFNSALNFAAFLLTLETSTITTCLAWGLAAFYVNKTILLTETKK